MSAPPPAPASQPAAPPMLLALRFVAALGVLGITPLLLWDLLVKWGHVAPPLPAMEQREIGMLLLLVACAATAAFSAWQPPGVPWRPVRAPFVLVRYLPFALVWLALVVAYLAAMRALGNVVPPQPALEHLATGDPGRAGYWAVVLVPVLGAPLAEEIVFRGYLQPALLGVMRPAWAIGITAAVFGAAHTLPYALPIGVLGAFFGWIAHRTGALWPAVLAHAVHNGATVVVAMTWPDALELLYPK